MFNQKEYKKQWREVNREKLKEKAKQYRKTNLERFKEYSKQYYLNNKEVIKERSRRRCIEHREELIKYSKQYYQNHKNEFREYRKQWKEINFERVKELNKEYRKNNSEKAKSYAKEYYQNDAEKFKERSNKYRQEHKKERNERVKYQRKTDLKFNINSRIRGAILKSLKRNKAGNHWEDLVGYTLNDLIKQLKSTMPKGYCWQDYFEGGLHIDHKIPIKVFNFTRPDHIDFKRCWALENLRLLPAKENLIKGAKLSKPFQLALQI